MMEIKAAMNETNNFMQTAFKDSASCSNQFLTANNGAFQTLATSIDGITISNPGVVDLSDSTTTTSSTAKIYLNRVYLGPSSAAQKAVEVNQPLPGMSAGKVKNIYIGDFTRSDSADDTKYIAQLVVNVDMQSSGLTAVKPIKLKMNIQTTTGDIHSRTMATCSVGDIVTAPAEPVGSTKIVNGPNCPSGYSVLLKYYSSKTCNAYTGCTTSAGLFSIAPTCTYYICRPGWCSNDSRACVADVVTQVLCSKN